MAQATAQSNPSRPISDQIIDRIWRFFCSVRAAIAEISFLALLVLIGTLRGSEAPQWLADALPFTQGLVDRWYAWDVFGSLLFALTLALIAVAIAVCTLNRAPSIWQTINHPRIATSRSWLRGAETSATFTRIGTADSLADDVSGILTKKRYRVLTERVGNDIHIYADKNRYAKLGTFPFHLALILILVGGLMAAHYGFREQEFIVVEGETRAVGHGTGLSIRLDRFSDDYTASGVAASYQSAITMFQDGKDVKSGDITVGHPMTYGSATVYQSSLGSAKSFRITDSTGNVVYEGAEPIGLFQLTSNPDSPAGLVDLPGISGQLVFAGQDTKPANRPELDTLNLGSDQLWIQMGLRDTTTGQMVNLPGQKITLNQPAKIGQYTITYTGTKQFSAMQVAYNPGVPIFIIAVVLLLGGLMATFYFPHRRVRALISMTGESTIVQMAPLAKRDWSGKRDFLRMIQDAQKTLGTPTEMKLPKSDPEWDIYKPATSTTA
ncbi:MAG: cytochrome c biogenesis protein ResB [Thermomicrobiales bacterium]